MKRQVFAVALSKFSISICESNCIRGGMYLSYHTSNKSSQSYARHGAFILYPIYKSKSLSNCVFLRVLAIVKTKYQSN